MNDAATVSPATLFALPLRGQGGVLLLIFSLGLYLVLVLLEFSRDTPAFRALVILLLSVGAVIGFGIFLQYTWAALRHVAEGDVAPIRMLELDELHPFLNFLALQVAGLLFVMASAIRFLYDVSTVAAATVAVVCAVGLPAVLGVIVLDERLASGLSAQRLARFVRGMGAAYVVFAASLYAGVASLYVVGFAMASPGVIEVLLATYTFVLGHVLAGWAVHAHRGRIKTRAVPVRVEATLDDGADVDSLMNELHRLCRADRIKHASTKLELFLRQRDYTVDESIHQRLLQFHDNRLLLEHSWHYIGRLMIGRKSARAWRLLCDSLDLDPLFRPGSDTQVMELVHAALPADARYVDMLLGDFERAYPDSALLPEAMFMHGRWLLVELDRGDAALELLGRLQTRFPQWGERFEFRALLSAASSARYD